MQRKSAFTLIEILVVIAVIGILSALITISFDKQQSLARDANRRQSLDTYQTSIELYRTAHSNYCVMGDPCTGGNLTETDQLGDSTVAATLNTDGYLTQIEHDPSYKAGWPDFQIQVCQADDLTTAGSSANALEYGLAAKLENSNPDTTTDAGGICGSSAMLSAFGGISRSGSFGVGSKRTLAGSLAVTSTPTPTQTINTFALTCSNFYGLTTGVGCGLTEPNIFSLTVPNQRNSMYVGSNSAVPTQGPSAGDIYSASSGSLVDVISPSTGIPLTSIWVKGNALQSIVSPNGRTDYVLVNSGSYSACGSYSVNYTTHNYSGCIAVISTSTNTVTTYIGLTFSSGTMELTPDGKTMYVLGNYSGELELDIIPIITNPSGDTLSQTTDPPTSDFLLSGYGSTVPNLFALANGYIYSVNSGSGNTVYIYNPTLPNPKNPSSSITLPISKSDLEAALFASPDGKYVYDLSKSTYDLYTITTTTNTITNTLTLSGKNIFSNPIIQPGTGTYAGDIYISSQNGANLFGDIISPDGSKKVGSYTGVSYPVAFSPDGSFLYQTGATNAIMNTSTNAFTSFNNQPVVQGTSPPGGYAIATSQPQNGGTYAIYTDTAPTFNVIQSNSPNTASSFTISGSVNGQNNNSPHSMVISPTTGTVFVSQLNNTILAIDPISNTLSYTLSTNTTGSSVYVVDLALSSDGNRLYAILQPTGVSNKYYISVFDLNSNDSKYKQDLGDISVSASSAPTGIAFSNKDSLVYISGAGHLLTIFNPSSSSVTTINANFQSTSTTQSSVAINPNNGTIYVSGVVFTSQSQMCNLVSFTAASYSQSTIMTSGCPLQTEKSLVVSQSGTVYTIGSSTSIADAIDSYNPISGTLSTIDDLVNLNSLYGLALSPDSSELYAVGSAGVQIFNTSTNTVQTFPTLYAATGNGSVIVTPAAGVNQQWKNITASDTPLPANTSIGIKASIDNSNFYPLSTTDGTNFTFPSTFPTTPSVSLYLQVSLTTSDGLNTPLLSTLNVTYITPAN